MPELLNGSTVNVLKEVNDKDYHFRRFKVNIMVRGRPSCKGRTKDTSRKAGNPRDLVVSENELVFGKPVKREYLTRQFTGEMRNGEWIVEHITILTSFAGKGKTFGSAKRNWILQYEKTL